MFGCRAKALLALLQRLEHKWATLNSNGHMAAHVTVIAAASVFSKSFRFQQFMQI